MSSTIVSARIRVPEGYNPTIDYLRLIAAFFIAFFHAKTPGAYWGEVAVAFFVVSMVLFAARSAERSKGSVLKPILARGEKLLGVWLVWTVISLALAVGSDVLIGRPFLADLLAWVPPQGSMAQLWFLPWAFLVTVAIFLAARVVPFTFDTRPAQGVAIGLTIAGSLACCLIATRIAMPLMPWLFILYLPSVFTGLLFYGLRGDGVVLLFAAALLALLGGLLSQMGWAGYLQLLYGVPITAVAMLLRTPELPWARNLATMAMDVYLTHILCIAVLGRVITVDSFLDGCLICAMAVCCSLVLQRLRPYLDYPVLRYI